MSTYVESLKPNAKNVEAISSLSITNETIVSAKADGEFDFLKYENGSAFTLNRWNTRRISFPALTEFIEAMKRVSVQSAELLCELYGVDAEGKMVMLPEFIRKFKGAGNIDNVRIGFFDLLSVNGKAMANQSYKWKIQEVEAWLQGCVKVQVLPYTCPKTVLEIEDFWKTWVIGRSFEGLMVRENGEIFKVKQHATVDAAILGINKRSRFKENEVTSLKLGLLGKDGVFVDMGDVASGIDKELRHALWGLMEFKVHEDNETVWVKPMIVIEIEYTQTFTQDMRRMRITDDGKLIFLGYQKAHTLRHPRLIRFRKDKKVIYEDIRDTQL